MSELPNPSPSSKLQRTETRRKVIPGNRLTKFKVFLAVSCKKLHSYLDAPFKFLFGRDIFISYSRADASKYVPKLANALRAEVPGVSLYLDRWIAPPSGELPKSLIRHLRWSNLLVVIATENALKSKFVKREIRRFAETGRPIVPVSVNGEWDKLSRKKILWKKIKGATPESEEKQNVESGTPSADVIDRIKNSTQFTRQDRRLVYAVRATVFGILVLIAGAFAVSLIIIQSAQAEAASRIQNAEAKERAAYSRASNAEGFTAMAEGKERAANFEAKTAEGRATTADINAQTAERKRQVAVKLEQQAKVRAQEQVKRNANLIYASDMMLAQRHNENDREFIGQQFLDSYLPGSSEQEPEAGNVKKDALRGFEWRYLWRVYRNRFGPELESLSDDAAFSPDGRLLAVITDNGITLWDTTVYEQQRTVGIEIDKGGEGVAVTFSPDSRLLAFGTDDGTVMVFNVVVSRKPERKGVHTSKLEFHGGEPVTFKPCSSPVTSLSFSADRTRLAISFEDAPLVLWDVTAKKLSTPDELKVKATAATFSPVGSTLAYAHGGQVYLSDGYGGAVPNTLEWSGAKVVELSFSPDGERLAAAGVDASARVWKVSSGEVIKTAETLSGHASSAIIFSPDGRFVATARFKDNYEGEAKLWDAATYKEVQTFKIGSGYASKNLANGSRVFELAFSTDGMTLLALEKGGDFALLNTTPQPLVLNTPWEIHHVIFSPDGKVIVTANGNGTVSVFDAVTRTETRVLTALDLKLQVKASGAEKQKSFPPVIALSQNGRILAASSGDNTYVTLWETDSYTKIGEFKAGLNPKTIFERKGIGALAFSADSKLLAVGFNHETKLYEIVKLRVPGAHQPTTTLVPDIIADYVREIVFLKDRRTLAVMDNRRILLWDLRESNETELELDTGRNDELSGMALSPNGKKLAVSHYSWVKIFNTEKLQAHNKRFFGGSNNPDHTIRIGGAGTMAFSPDGRTLVASDNNNGSVKLWSSVSGQELITLRGHQKGVVALAFSPDGLTLATGGLDQTLRLWFAATDEEVKRQPTPF